MIGSIGLVTDSNAQLPPEMVNRYRVDVVPLTVVVDGAEYDEGVDLDADAFYAAFERATPTVSTSQPSPGRFAHAYERAAAHGATEILSIHIGSAVSGTMNSARIAADSSPVPVRLVDTGTASFGVGCCVWEAAEALLAGASLDEAVAVAHRVATSVANVFVVRGLDLARAGGRLVAGSEAGDGVPVLSLVDGQVVVIGRSTDMAGAAEVMAGHITQLGRSLRVAVGVADTGAEPLRDQLEQRLTGHPTVKEMIRYRIGPSVGAHTGPGTVGAFFYPSPRAWGS